MVIVTRLLALAAVSLALALPAKAQTAISLNINWDPDGSACHCNVTVLQKGMNGAPDTMIFAGTTDSSGHLAATVALVPTNVYLLTIYSNYYKIQIGQVLFSTQFLSSRTLKSIALHPRFTRPQINGSNSPAPVTVPECVPNGPTPCYEPPALVGI